MRPARSIRAGPGSGSSKVMAWPAASVSAPGLSASPAGMTLPRHGWPSTTAPGTRPELAEKRAEVERERLMRAEAATAGRQRLRRCAEIGRPWVASGSAVTNPVGAPGLVTRWSPQPGSALGLAWESELQGLSHQACSGHVVLHRVAVEILFYDVNRLDKR
jgi:hypothetical protein